MQVIEVIATRSWRCRPGPPAPPRRRRSTASASCRRCCRPPSAWRQFAQRARTRAAARRGCRARPAAADAEEDGRLAQAQRVRAASSSCGSTFSKAAPPEHQREGDDGGRDHRRLPGEDEADAEVLQQPAPMTPWLPISTSRCSPAPSAASPSAASGPHRRGRARGVPARHHEADRHAQDQVEEGRPARHLEVRGRVRSRRLPCLLLQQTQGLPKPYFASTAWAGGVNRKSRNFAASPGSGAPCQRGDRVEGWAWWSAP